MKSRNLLICIIAIIVLLATGQYANKIEASEYNDLNIMIVGSSIEIEQKDCWSNHVEYKADGLKIVTMEYCDKNGKLLKAWYKAKWSIEGKKIKETTFEASPIMIKALGSLPHTEIDSIETLTKDRLVIINNKPAKFTIYQRADLIH